jgi:hypothetical protein
MNLMAGRESVEPRLFHPRRQQQIFAQLVPLDFAKLNQLA